MVAAIQVKVQVFGLQIKVIFTSFFQRHPLIAIRNDARHREPGNINARVLIARATPHRVKERLVLQIHDPAFTRLRARDVASRNVEGIFLTITSRGIRFVAGQTQHFNHVFDAHGVCGRQNFRIVEFVLVIVTRDLPPAQTHTIGLRGSMTVFVALIGGSEVKVTVVAFNGRRIATLFNGVFNQARRGNDVFFVVDIDVADSKHVGDQHHLIVRDALGDIVVTLDNVQDPSFVFVGNRVVTGAPKIAVFV